jgi:hypothetical protein
MQSEKTRSRCGRDEKHFGLHHFNGAFIFRTGIGSAGDFNANPAIEALTGQKPSHRRHYVSVSFALRHWGLG